jgi:hypothetical protein
MVDLRIPPFKNESRMEANRREIRLPPIAKVQLRREK